MSEKTTDSLDLVEMRHYQQHIESQLGKAGHIIEDAIKSNDMEQVKEAQRVIAEAQNKILQAQDIVDSKNLI